MTEREPKTRVLSAREIAEALSFSMPTPTDEDAKTTVFARGKRSCAVEGGTPAAVPRAKLRGLGSPRGSSEPPTRLEHAGGVALQPPAIQRAHASRRAGLASRIRRRWAPASAAFVVVVLVLCVLRAPWMQRTADLDVAPRGAVVPARQYGSDIAGTPKGAQRPTLLDASTAHAQTASSSSASEVTRNDESVLKAASTSLQPSMPPRLAVDALLSGRHGLALDAYRSLAHAQPEHEVYALVARCLERERRCRENGEEPCSPR